MFFTAVKYVRECCLRCCVFSVLFLHLRRWNLISYGINGIWYHVYQLSRRCLIRLEGLFNSEFNRDR